MLVKSDIERERLVLTPLSELSLTIVEFVREHGRVTMAEMLQLTRVSRNTLKGHFKKLVEAGKLVQRGQGRGAWSSLS